MKQGRYREGCLRIFIIDKIICIAVASALKIKGLFVYAQKVLL
jgi:hypothetical protein